jgi:hypothetical protein
MTARISPGPALIQVNVQPTIRHIVIVTFFKETNDG